MLGAKEGFSVLLNHKEFVGVSAMMGRVKIETLRIV